MTDSNLMVTEDLADLEPVDVPVPKMGRSRKDAAKRAARPALVPDLPVVSLAALLAGDDAAVETVKGALADAGFLDGLPDGSTLAQAYGRLQRYLGYGLRPTGIPEEGSLTWLALRTQTFTTTP